MSDLVQWWNLPFTIPFGLAVVYLLFTAFGLVTAGADAEFGPDSDVGAEVEVDADAAASDVQDADASDQAAPSHPEYVAEPRAIEQEPARIARILDFFGLGRVPLTIIIQTFFLIWSFAGWTATSALSRVFATPWLFFVPSLLIAGVVAVLLTRVVARPLARWMPSTETYAVGKQQLVGRIGEVVLPVTVTSGTVQVHDTRGNLHQIACRVGGEGVELPRGSEVIVVSFEEAANRYLVVASELDHRPAADSSL